MYRIRIASASESHQHQHQHQHRHRHWRPSDCHPQPCRRRQNNLPASSPSPSSSSSFWSAQDLPPLSTLSPAFSSMTASSSTVLSAAAAASSVEQVAPTTANLSVPWRRWPRRPRRPTQTHPHEAFKSSAGAPTMMLCTLNARPRRCFPMPTRRPPSPRRRPWRRPSTRSSTASAKTPNFCTERSEAAYLMLDAIHGQASQNVQGHIH